MAGNSTSSGDDVKTALKMMKLVGYVVVFVAGVALNILLLLAVTRKQIRHKNTAKTFIIMMQNLAVADLLLLISTIPFDAAWHETVDFPYGEGMCKFLWPFQTACFQAVVFTYVILSFHRTYGVKAQLFGQIKRDFGYLVVFIVWIASFATVIPYMVFLKHTTGKVNSCDEDWEKLEHRKTYTVFLFLLQYLIPLLVMFVLFIYTWFELRNYSYNRSTAIEQRADRHKRVTVMLIIYLAVFAVLMLPHQIMWFLLDFGNGADDPFFFDVLNFLYVFTYSVTITNVVLFFVYNSEFKSDMWYFLRCYCCRDRPYSVEEDNSESFSVENNANQENIPKEEHRMEPYNARGAQYNQSSSMEPYNARGAKYNQGSSMEP